mmetsp:Transcript_8421/g.12836  ORF Transcript_8421/g.12836 Transcript_8421/m.12836 type:complete len:373 (-) Transcript_8421:2-1120(-)
MNFLLMILFGAHGKNFVMQREKVPPVIDSLSIREEKNCSILFSPSKKEMMLPKCQPPPLYKVRSWKCKAHFFILGVRKGGTTSLMRYISAHPDVHKYKIHGRPDDGENRHRIGSNEHAFEYEKVPSYKLVGDANVRRLVNDAEALGKFCRSKPPRFFVLLRETVEQCHSVFLMRARLQSTAHINLYSNLTLAVSSQLTAFRSYIRSQDSRRLFLDLGPPPPEFRSSRNCLYETFYILHLHRLIRHVPQSSVRIYWTDDLRAHTKAVAEDAMRFLGLDATLISSSELDSLTRNRFNAQPTIYSTSTEPSNDDNHVSNLLLSDNLVLKIRQTMAPFNYALLKLLKVEALPTAWTSPTYHWPALKLKKIIIKNEK